MCKIFEEYLKSLTHDFRDQRADFVVLDSSPRNQKFLAACVAWSLNEGLPVNDVNVDDSQSEILTFRLTQEGKKVIIFEKQPQTLLR